MKVNRREVQGQSIRNKTQHLITVTSNRLEYFLNLTRAILSYNTPLNKLENPTM